MISGQWEEKEEEKTKKMEGRNRWIEDKSKKKDTALVSSYEIHGKL